MIIEIKLFIYKKIKYNYLQYFFNKSEDSLKFNDFEIKKFLQALFESFKDKKIIPL